MTEDAPSTDPPLVSVLMSAYNHGEYLAQAIESVIGQRAPFRFELLIGDDCSTDNTREVAEDYQRRHPESIRVFTSEQNVGAYLNDVRLTHSSRGTYLAYCEGDDYWNTHDKLARQVGYLQAHPDFGAVHSEFSWIARLRGRWRSIPRTRRYQGIDIPEGDLFDVLLRTQLMQTCTVLVRSDLVRQYLRSDVPFADSVAADWPFVLFLSRNTRIGYLDEPLATYRKTPGSVMNQDAAGRLALARLYVAMLTELCDYFGVDDATKLDVLRHLMSRVPRSALRAGEVHSTREALRWLRAHPPNPLSPRGRLLLGVAASHRGVTALFRAADSVNEAVGLAALKRHRAFRAPPPAFPTQG